MTNFLGNLLQSCRLGVTKEPQYEAPGLLGFARLTPTYTCYITKAAYWPNSSNHRYIEAGIIDRDWAGRQAGFPESGFGDR